MKVYKLTKPDLYFLADDVRETVTEQGVLYVAWDGGLKVKAGRYDSWSPLGVPAPEYAESQSAPSQERVQAAVSEAYRVADDGEAVLGEAMGAALSEALGLLEEFGVWVERESR